MSNDLRQGAILLLSGELMLSIMAALIKYLSQDVSHEMLVFTRNLFGLLFLLPLISHHGLRSLKTTRFGAHLMRSVVGVAAMYGYFYVITHLPLAEAALVKLSSPFFLPLIALLWLGERINLRTMWAIIIGFVGVVFVLRPGAETFQPVALVGVGAAVLASLAKVTIRHMADTEPGHRIVFYFGILATLVSAVPLLWGWTSPGLSTLPWLAAIGLTGTLGQLLMTKAYQVAKPGQVGPFTYTAVLYAALFGWMFWDEVVIITTLIGSALIIGAGILNMKSSQK
ncbi:MULTISPECIES: DMT family transporter [unclassified Ketobacter]|uniref:DMT family transporter n=1 Tax=unclassified Ketobacter TaxID=2639109 RepID=UPI000F163404|nr:MULTISPECIES: DMT family transporter [unclassified Ketobacter]RLT91645.1 MAG: DMT family transporter [Ketobacter sp. GenoA1]RLT96075.1 MAG: DMT family transporter [Ketobacter sp.]